MIMTIEEKAKAYDKALNIAREILDHTSENYLCTHLTKEDIKDMYIRFFPELKESEDEKIRKALVRFHKSTIDVDGIKGEDIIAWLEKQGEKLPTGFYYVNSEGEKFYSDTFKYGDVILHVDKQDEQKPIIEMKTPEESLGISSKEYNNIVNDCLYGEQKSDDSYCQENCRGYQETGKCFADGGCKTKIEAEQKTATWDGEDNAYKLFAISAVEDYYDGKNPLRKDIIDWLNSLKQRMGG